jgi:O-acetyl-ADP-ribose deacetylase (regulator of RNase III)
LKNKIIYLFTVCQAGEVCVTKGHSLPTRYILHTVCPIYNQKNRVASIWSENTLQLCYRNVLSKAKELGLQTIGLCTLSVQRNFPSDIAVHIALSNFILNI